MTPDHEEMRAEVRDRYAEIARSRKTPCGTSRCETEEVTEGYSMIGDAYDGVSGYVADADLGLGCGLPVEHAGLESGMTVLDLGSGAGLDAFVARHEVGQSGHVVGVDMTPEMIARSRDNAARSGFENVEFRLGEIEHLPVESGSVDVVISNCVLNLVPDKQQAFHEIFRVLKPGGHFCVSDVVASSELPSWARDIAEAYAGCVSGAVSMDDYLATIKAAGFDNARIVKQHRIDIPSELLAKYLTADQIRQAEETDLHVASVTVTATKASASG